MDLHGRAKLGEHLSAGSARACGFDEIGDDRNRSDRAHPACNGMEHRRSLGANRQPVARILNVATAEDPAVIGEHRSPYTKPRRGCVGLRLHRARRVSHLLEHMRWQIAGSRDHGAERLRDGPPPCERPQGVRRTHMWLTNGVKYSYRLGTAHPLLLCVVVRIVLLLPVSVGCLFAALSEPRIVDPYTVIATPTAVAVAVAATTELSAHEPESGFLTKIHGNRLERAALPLHGAAWIYGTPGEPNLPSAGGVHPIGVRRLAFVAHPHREIERLSREQIAQLYAGSISNWRQLGGPDAPIRMLRTTDAEDLESIRRYLGCSIQAESIPADAFSGDERCKRLVTGDPFAIGTMSLDEATRAIDDGAPLRILPVGSQPGRFNSTDIHGELVRTLQLCVAHPDDGRSDRLLAYFASSSGRSALSESGFEPLAAER